MQPEAILMDAHEQITEHPKEFIIPLIQKAGQIKHVQFNKFKKKRETNVHFMFADDSHIFSIMFPDHQHARMWLKEYVIEIASPEIVLDICGIDAGQLTHNIAISNNRAFMAVVEDAMEIAELCEE